MLYFSLLITNNLKININNNLFRIFLILLPKTKKIPLELALLPPLIIIIMRKKKKFCKKLLKNTMKSILMKLFSFSRNNDINDI